MRKYVSDNAMKKSITIILTCIFTLAIAGYLVAGVAYAEEGKRFTAKEASYHIGEIATVCGVVASAKWATRTKGQPTFINLDEPYPNQIFTILIWGSDRPAFGTPENMYARKRICVTGKIKEYRGKAEIIVKNPSQIKIE